MSYFVKLVIVFYLITQCIESSAKTYYVTPSGGNDLNPGTIDKPWATWQKAFDAAQSGDTVYFRGGIWYPNSRVLIGSYGHPVKTGTYSNPICYFNYPGEEPVLDCSNFTSTSGNDGGIDITGCSYLKLRGLTIRNVKQKVGDQYIVGVGIYECGTIWLERVISHGNWGHGFQLGSYDTLYVKYCDSYNNADSISYVAGIGNRADGFTMGSGGPIADTNKIIYFTGCRSWHNSDDGFDIGSTKQFQFSHCWAFENGYLEQGAGNGFKTAVSWLKTPSKRRISNCISAFNGNEAIETGSGFAESNLSEELNGPVVEYYNNIAYKCVALGFSSDNSDFNCNTGYAKVIYRNNIVYNGEGSMKWQVYLTACHSCAPYYPSYTIADHNTWSWTAELPYFYKNPDVTVTDNDFVSVDSVNAISELTAPRKADGSLPDLTFLRLKEGSDLIDAGVDVGLPYAGSAPDMGYCEFIAGPITLPEPKFLSAKIENATPARLEITCSLPLVNILPVTSAFTVTVNSSTRNINSVSISGTNVLLTLASKVLSGDVVTVTYTKPANNPVQTSAGGQLASFIAQNVTNNCSPAINQPPIISISSPTKNTEFISPATISINAVASDPDGSISKVEFYNGNSKLGETNSIPYYYTWKDVPEGTYLLSAIATDNQNLKTISESVSLTVQKSTSAINQLPEVSITNPHKGKKYKKNISIVLEAVASDPDGVITKVEFKSGTSTIAEITEAPYIYIWENADSGNYVLTAIATDNLGASSVSSEVQFSILDFNDPDFIALYPNPTYGHFTVDLSSVPKNEINRISIINLSGKTILNNIILEEESLIEFDLPYLPAGIYVLALTSNDCMVTTKKFIKK